ncbi:NAD(P)/FAD-dependent oxidoreductase [Gluconobacter wancherniae]|uniref:NAD(P)/FAD-dependent oxidoreductase n=1 Tax=Gluconobacter wancherniae TaxID=1307955 RepID=UPI001B8AF512|nr:FAD-dependent oxidoreductase [Gluconobacter wancherniae]MBS1089913.1 FAD-dependent oxidoreductase [Gluconobacter wancherniae]
MYADTLIIGASHAGVQCAASLLDGGYTGKIILAGDESALPYHRPPLSKGFLADGRHAQDIALKGADFYTQDGIELRLGLRATSIIAESKSVIFSDDTIINYRNLVLATGSRPSAVIRHALPQNVHELRTIADAGTLALGLAQTSGVVAIIGGGYVGLELAATIRTKYQRDVVIVEAADRLLARSASPALAEWVARYHQAAGSTLILGTRMRHLCDEAGKVTGVELEDGRRIDADLVILGLGIVPNQEIARDAGIECNDGILVDRCCQTSMAHVYAIGDCARTNFGDDSPSMRLECVQNANDQGRVAASAILDAPKPYYPVLSFWSDQLGLKLQTAGIVGEGVRHVQRGDMEGAKASLFHFDTDYNLCAVETINAPAIHMQAKKILALSEKFDVARLESANFDLKILL